MASAHKKKEDKNEKSPAIVAQYRNRLSVLRIAHEYDAKKEYAAAVEGYNKYLVALCSFFEIEESQLRPSHFDQQKELGEILLLSQVYWNLAKVYDNSQKYVGKCQHCLEQFVRFSSGYKFQYLNSETIKRHLRAKQAKHEDLFLNAYKQIQVSSKKCYIATYCFSSEHNVTEILRKFKIKILDYNLGLYFVDMYYRFSPRLVTFFEKHQIVGQTTRILFFRPILWTFAKLIQRTII